VSANSELLNNVIWSIAAITSVSGLVIQFIANLKDKQEQNSNRQTKIINPEPTGNIKNSSITTINHPNSFIKNTNQPLEKIFIVHGRDELAKIETARFIEKLGIEAIILHEQANSGKTIIEKIEEYTNVGFAIVLYTPCDTGNIAGEKTQRSRARQNVVFEHGYLIGKLGRHNVCALVKGDIEIPNDISGIVYIPFDSHGAWRLNVVQELRKTGYEIDMNRI